MARNLEQQKPEQSIPFRKFVPIDGQISPLVSLPNAASFPDPPHPSVVDVPVSPPYSSSYAGDGSASKACAACRFRRQKCKGDCLLVPFFPAADESRFQKAHCLFGVSRMKKTLKSLLPDQRAVSTATMIYESEVRAANPNIGCLDIILQLHSQIERHAAHLARLRQHHSLLSPPAPTVDTVITGDSEIIPPTGNLKRRFQNLPEEEEAQETTMRQSRRRRTSQ